ncbi:MAG: hypothetical protein A3D67_00915 [Candidatus Lloydbacteria bacterium RIFCSPHIGHO2_02_FULL_51_22]|uniref:t-SNARE coiled-coil homology domain-containing protein n=3 Tax=Candidatus Lloydiibacteriota TaxID=1817910 RepID=A0A1G2D7N6_9BACT|nr:MAG: hypothetical protein A3D67_00915 [Candidatus Lloydbacteria bacterium RIFCSPHIGHO2_02_FULL_51_22]OGZ15050.1 MAG: hypothetical protein A3J08_01755 [Candidatus Lloydbacteria bacterium RIFCSPLOWO2_02_FULL_51_11]OGZ16937.1 MAG: hypothetical protein A3G11_00820 [Candidatus Lloydbacteria bacterium RIFCSPLOWO2_12_FULL_51_9]
MDKDTKKEIEKLARMVSDGFTETNKKIDDFRDEVDARFEQVDGRLGGIDDRLDHTNARLLVIERDIAEIRAHFVYRNEFEDLMGRVQYLEKKMGVKSGK